MVVPTGRYSMAVLKEVFWWLHAVEAEDSDRWSGVAMVP
jgi:hypothetical protein